MRTLLRAGDTVIVEDPGYCNLLQILQLAGLVVQGVPRTPAGIDTDVLERWSTNIGRRRSSSIRRCRIRPARPSAWRRRSVCCRSPNGTACGSIEDDVNRELAPPGAPLLAAMEGLNRVLYVGGFSKTITPGLRCGYVVAERDVLRELARTKMAVGLTSSAATERIVDKVLTRRALRAARRSR